MKTNQENRKGRWNIEKKVLFRNQGGPDSLPHYRKLKAAGNIKSTSHFHSHYSDFQILTILRKRHFIFQGPVTTHAAQRCLPEILWLAAEMVADAALQPEREAFWVTSQGLNERATCLHVHTWSLPNTWLQQKEF